MSATHWQPNWQNQHHPSQTTKPMKKPKRRRKPKKARRERSRGCLGVFVQVTLHLYTNFTWIHIDYLQGEYCYGVIVFYVELEVQVTWYVY